MSDSSNVKAVTINPSFGMKLTLAGIRQKFSTAPQISTENFYSIWLQSSCTNSSSDERVSKCDNLLLLDVRSKEEYDISCIEGALWINDADSMETNVQRVKQMVAEKIEQLRMNSTSSGAIHTNELNVIAYCSIGYRSSALICKIVQERILSNDSREMVKFYNLEGSIFKWANEGRALLAYANGTYTKADKVHPYSSLWGMLLNKDLRKSS